MSQKARVKAKAHHFNPDRPACVGSAAVDVGSTWLYSQNQSLEEANVKLGESSSSHLEAGPPTESAAARANMTG